MIDNDGDELNERYLTNFLLFGCLGLNTLKKLIQSDEMTSKEEVKLKEESLDDVLFELTVDDCSNDVTFSQVIKQYLNLSTRIDNLGQVLALIVGIVNYFFLNKSIHTTTKNDLKSCKIFLTVHSVVNHQ